MVQLFHPYFTCSLCQAVTCKILVVFTSVQLFHPYSTCSLCQAETCEISVVFTCVQYSIPIPPALCVRLKYVKRFRHGYGIYFTHLPDVALRKAAACRPWTSHNRAAWTIKQSTSVGNTVNSIDAF